MEAGRKPSGHTCTVCCPDCIAGTCPKHCGATKRSSHLCANPKGKGTDHLGIGTCSSHLGSTRNHVKRANDEKAHRAVVTFGLPREIDPHGALLEELHRTAGHVAWLSSFIAEMDEDELKQRDMTGKFEKPAIWVELYQAERAHYAKVAKAAIDAGIEERRVKMAEGQGELLGQVIRNVLADVFGLLATAGIAADLLRRVQRDEVPPAVRRRLLEIAEVSG